MWCGIKAERASSGLSLITLARGGRIAAIEYDRQSAKAGHHLTQKLEPLASSVGALHRQSSDVATRSREAHDETSPYRIDRKCKDDGYGRSSSLFQSGNCATISDNNIDVLSHELRCNLSDAVGTSF
jgi:hypothetical protein